MDDLLIVRSDRFSFEAPEIDGLIYDVALGNDLAAYLQEPLERHLGSSWEILDPCLEDFGTVLICTLDNECFCVTITWHIDDRDRSEQPCWMIQFSQSHGCFSLFFTRKDNERALTVLANAVVSVVEEDTDTFISLRWTTWPELERESEKKRDEGHAIRDALRNRCDPTSPSPARTAYGATPNGRTFYAGLYASGAFPNLQSFAAYCEYTANAQIQLFSGSSPDVVRESWEPRDNIRTWMYDPPTPIAEAKELIRSWRLPAHLTWIHDAEFVEVLVYEALDPTGEMVAIQVRGGWIFLLKRHCPTLPD